MKIRVKKINGEEFTTETEKTIEQLFTELSNNMESSFILLGNRIEQKMTIESVVKQ